jgi:lysozyme
MMIILVTSTNGKSFLMGVENTCLKAYPDKKRNGVWTIGTGHTKNVKAGDVITMVQAREFLVEDLKCAEDAVSAAVKLPIEQHQFDMLISATFNLGPDFVNDADMQKALNSGKTREAAALFVLWSLDDGIVVDGLLKRRAMESRIFQQGYTSRNLAWIAKQTKY